MPGPPMVVNTGQGPLQLSTTLGQDTCLAVTGILHAMSAGFRVLQNTGPALLRSIDGACVVQSKGCFSTLGSVRDGERFVSRRALVPGQIHGQC